MAGKFMTGMAMIRCNSGVVPVPLMLPVSHGITSKGQPLVNANDHIPMVNILPFGICSKKPVLPPGANVCIPITPMAWKKADKNCFIAGAPALTKDSCLTCMLGGTIKFL